MQKKDFKHVLDVLNELSLYVYECMENEESAANKKALRKCFFNFKPFPLSDFEARQLERLNNLPVGRPTEPPNRRSGDDVAKQLNNVTKKEGFKEQKEGDKMLVDISGVCVGKHIRPDGRWQGYYNFNGRRYFVYAKTREEVIEKLQKLIKRGVKDKECRNRNGVPQTFEAFFEYYFEKFRKKKVSPKTYYNDFSRYKTHLKPHFNKKLIRQITPGDCQDLLDKLSEMGKTSDEIFSLMNITFKAAILHGLITKNPLDIVYREPHQRTHGTALSSEEIETLKTCIKGTSLEQAVMILLYCGLRPNELVTVRIDGPFVVAQNSKRKNRKIEYKKIPITPMLAPFLKEPFNFPTHDFIGRHFKQILPNHKLYDLRTTFYSKCKECGVAQVALNHFVGHSNGVLGDTYTTLSNDYLLEEGNKIRF